MTLKARNRYTFVFSVLFLGVSIFFLIHFALDINSVLQTETISIFRNSILTIIFAGICMLVYIPAASFYLYSHFTKTPAPEVIYFMLFLIGSATELLRFLIPMEIMQNYMSEITVMIGRALFWGRTFCFASLFIGAVASSPDQRINAEQNIFMLAIFSLILANLVPINTTEIPNSFNVNMGLGILAKLFYSIIIILTFATYSIKAWRLENKNYFILGIDILLIEVGFYILNTSGILAMVIPGAFMLAFCTFHYLSLLHKQYA